MSAEVCPVCGHGTPPRWVKSLGAALGITLSLVVVVVLLAIVVKVVRWAIG